MFKKLRKRIFGSIFLVLLAFLLLLTFISYGIIYNNLYQAQKERTRINAENACKSYLSYFDAVMSFVQNATYSSAVIDVLNGEVGDITATLDGLCNYAVRIDGAVLYGLNGYVAYSAGVGSPPTLRELRRVEGIDKFLQSEELTYVSARNKEVAQYYNHTKYPAERGVVSCMCKVFDEGELIGVLCADILTETISLNRSGFISFGAQGKILLYSDELLSDSAAYKDIYDRSEGNGRARGYYVDTAECGEICSVAMFAPLNEFARRMQLIFALFFGVGILLTVACALLANYVCKKIIDPLEELYHKMTANAASE